MNKNTSGIFSSSPTDPSRRAKRSFWQSLVEPPAVITVASERRQASLVSALLLVLALAMISGVVYMGFFTLSPAVGYVLAVSDIIIGISYVLSRTRYNRQAAFLP
jgi:hypothetical protein